MNQLAKCEDCGSQFPIDQKNVVYQERFKTKNGQIIFLTYYDCPECGRRHWVQVDDTQTLGMLRQQQKMFVRLAKKRSNGQDVGKKQSAKFAKAQKDLSNNRNELMKEFTGKTVVNEETGESYKLRFSV